MTLADHRPYITAVADHLTAAGLPVRSWHAERTPRTARIVIERGDYRVALHWHEIRGWEYSDSAYDDDEPEGLPFAHVVDPPAIVLSALISESWTARRMLRDEVPDDEESALAAYAETGPRPGQEVATPSGGTWTYVDIGSGDLHLISTARLHSIAWTREEFNDTLVTARGAADVMPAEEEAELIGVLDELLDTRAETEGSR